MTDDAGKRSRPARVLLWLGAGVLALMLIAAGGVLWVFTDLSGDRDEARQEALARIEESADSIEHGLRARARDGVPTGEEIRRIVSEARGSVVSTSERPRGMNVIAELHESYQTGFGNSGLSRCIRVALTNAGTPEPNVVTTRLKECPRPTWR